MEADFSYEMYPFPMTAEAEKCEQGVEWEGILPDYLPDINRIVRCSLTPCVLDRHFVGENLRFEGEIHLRVAYESQESDGIFVYETSQPFSKTVSLAVGGSEICCRILPKVNYCHGRATGKRKIELRGAVSFETQVLGVQEEKLPQGATTEGVECHTKTIPVTTVLFAGDLQSDEEGVFLTDKKPVSLLEKEALFSLQEVRPVDGKLLCKGEIDLHLLLMWEGGEIERLEKKLPFTRVLESADIVADSICQGGGEIVSLTVELPEEGEESSITALAEFYLWARLLAEKELTVLDDAFSVNNPIKLTKTEKKFPKITEIWQESGSTTDRIKWNDDPPVKILDLFARLEGVAYAARFGEVAVRGNLVYTFFCQKEDGMVYTLEKSLPFEITKPLGGGGEECFSGNLLFLSASLSEESAEGVTVKANLLLEGIVFSLEKAEIVTDMEADESRTAAKKHSGGIILYFGEKDESLWEICKRYEITLLQLKAENHLQEEKLSEKQLLLIPSA